MSSKSFLGIGVLCILWLLGACRPTTSWTWERADAGLPRQVVITALAVDPARPGHLWAGSYAPDGLVVSQDGGRTWRAGDQGPRDNPAFDLLSLSDGVLWAGTRNGVMRSADGGITWTLVTDERLPSSAAFALAADALGQIYVGFDNAGLYRGNPERNTWEPLAEDEAPGSFAILSLAVSPDGRHLYAGTASHGLYASQDAGRSWTNAFPGSYVPNLAIDPYSPMTAIASLRDRLVRTRDGGQSWETLSVAWARDEVVSLLWLEDHAAGSPRRLQATGRLLAGSGQGQVYCSQDGAESWNESGARVPAQGGVLALEMTADQLLAGTWTGIYSSPAQSAPASQPQASGCADLGLTWTDLSPSLGIPNANALLTVGTHVLIGTRSGLFRWQPTAHRWQEVPLTHSPGHDAPAGGVSALAAGPSPEKPAYAGTVSGELYRSHDGGATWMRVPSDVEIGIQDLAVSPEDANRVYMLALWERVYESRDAGQSWVAHWTGLGVTAEAISLAIDPIKPSTIYLGTDSGLYRSRYGGNDWRPVGRRLDDQTVLYLVARPSPNPEDQKSILYIGATRGAYQSTDGGDTIQPWGQGLEGISVTAILFDPNDPLAVYTGTAYAGLYGSVDGGKTWQPMGPSELAGEAVEGLTWGPEGELFVASAGAVWMGRRE